MATACVVIIGEVGEASEAVYDRLCRNLLSGRRIVKSQRIKKVRLTQQEFEKNYWQAMQDAPNNHRDPWVPMKGAFGVENVVGIIVGHDALDRFDSFDTHIKWPKTSPMVSQPGLDGSYYIETGRG